MINKHRETDAANFLATVWLRDPRLVARPATIDPMATSLFGKVCAYAPTARETSIRLLDLLWEKSQLAKNFACSRFSALGSRPDHQASNTARRSSQDLAFRQSVPRLAAERDDRRSQNRAKSALPNPPEPYSRPASHPDAECRLGSPRVSREARLKRGFANTVTADDGNLLAR